MSQGRTGCFDNIFRMESAKSRERHDHRKDKKLKHLLQWKMILGIQGTSHKEMDSRYMLKKAMKRISILEWNDNKKEERIQELLQEKDSDLQSQILTQQREILALKSSAGNREELIRRQQKQIEELKREKRILQGEKEDLRNQIWLSSQL